MLTTGAITSLGPGFSWDNSASDVDQLRERGVTEPADYLTSVRLHPEGESVVLTARGRLVVAPVGSGRLVGVSRGRSGGSS